MVYAKLECQTDLSGADTTAGVFGRSTTNVGRRQLDILKADIRAAAAKAPFVPHLGHCMCSQRTSAVVARNRLSAHTGPIYEEGLRVTFISYMYHVYFLIIMICY